MIYANFFNQMDHCCWPSIYQRIGLQKIWPQCLCFLIILYHFPLLNLWFSLVTCKTGYEDNLTYLSMSRDVCRNCSTFILHMIIYMKGCTCCVLEPQAVGWKNGIRTRLTFVSICSTSKRFDPCQWHTHWRSGSSFCIANRTGTELVK